MIENKVLRPFSYYLDCVQYCRQHSISFSCIVRKSFRIWNIKEIFE